MSEERKTIYLCLAHMSEDKLEEKYVKEAFDTNWVVPMGPNVNAFEKDLEAFVNSRPQSSFPSEENKAPSQQERAGGEASAPFPSGEGRGEAKVVCLSAGTAAVHLALLACGVGPGDEVCVQSFTFCASSHPITYLGATPVFIDSEADTWNMDPQLLEQAILDRKEKTGKYPKAIVPVALYGMPYKIDEIMAIANKYGIPVVEDAAEGMGSRFNGQVLGTFGKFGVLSFNGNKMITTSGGGALICQNAADAQTIMWYATQARDAYPYYEHTAIGYNYRMSNVCAGIGRGQMTVLNDHIAHHKHVQELYKELLQDVPGITLHEQPADPRYDANFWLCAATIDPEIRVKGQENAYKEVIKIAVGGAAGVIKAVDSATTDCQPNENVEALRVFMLSKKVECRPVWKPMHKQPVYNALYELRYENENWVSYEGPKSSAYLRKESVCESIFKVGFCLPAGPYVTDDDVRYIVDCIKEAIVK
ncbi:MAG: aminotransferase class I/II-fold pyridoxal phosphate-dependent enzyme [Bacteroidales bacterium]|nr:aminotransferase class I/II-fold pyridoxal phosphate-dependent enzyme [Candidatus Physcousia equi]